MKTAKVIKQQLVVGWKDDNTAHIASPHLRSVCTQAQTLEEEKKRKKERNCKTKKKNKTKNVHPGLFLF